MNALIQAAGDTLNSVTPEDFGQARRVWADRDYLSIVRGQGQGDSRHLRDHFKQLQLSLTRTTDRDIRRKLQDRLGRLLGRVRSIVGWGGHRNRDKTRKTLANHAAHTLHGTIRSGMVPGGGAAVRGAVSGAALALTPMCWFTTKNANKLLKSVSLDHKYLTRKFTDG